MAKSLKIEIAMAGDAEIKKQFDTLSAAGKDCFSEIAAEANKVGFQNLDPSFLEEKYKKFNVTGKETVAQINEIVATGTKFQQLAEAVGLVEKALMRAGIAGKALLLVMNPIGAAITIVVALLGAALVGAAISAAKSISALERQAISLGTSFEQLSKLKNVMGAAGIPFDAVSQGLQKLQKDIDKFSLERVEQAFAKAQQNIAAGWGPGSEQIRILQKAAEGVGPAAEAARKALEALGQPINDRVTPIIEGMVKWAGDAVKAIPLIRGELDRLGTSGEKARFMSDILKQVVADSPDAVAALQNVIRAMEQMPPSAQRDRAIVDALGQDLGTRLVQAAKQGGTSISDLFEKVKGGSQETADAASKIDLAINKIKAGFAAAFENIPLGKLSEVLDGASQKVQGFAQAVNNISWEQFTTGATTAMTTVNPLIQSMVTSVQQVQTSLSQDLWSLFVSAATTALTAVNSIIQQLVISVQGIPSAFATAASGVSSAIGQIISEVDVLIQRINAAMAALGSLQANAAGGALGAHASGGLLRGRGSGTSDSNLAWVSRGEYIMPAKAVRSRGVLAFLEALRRSGGRFARGGLVGFPAFQGGGLVQSYVDQIGQFVESIVGSMNSLLQIIHTMVSQVNGLAALAGKTVQFGGAARGGLMGGRGTGTSDSNLAWVSRGEHIMPARAVRAPGVLAFLEALRRSGGNLQGVLDRMGHFALGGMAFAAGGAVGGMSNVTIQFPGVPPISGLRASSAVVDELRRSAALAQVRSGGRKPSRYS